MPRGPVIHQHRAKDADNSTAVAFNLAVKRDRLQYLRGIKSVKLLNDHDQWNAAYDPNTDTIELEQKFDAKPLAEKVEILLHEAGHRGERLEPETYLAYQEARLSSVESFLSMANCVHQKDFAENGIEPSVMAQEEFAESYSRFCLGRDMPESLREFWSLRAS
jgi:hypothetical protein